MVNSLNLILPAPAPPVADPIVGFSTPNEKSLISTTFGCTTPSQLAAEGLVLGTKRSSSRSSAKAARTRWRVVGPPERRENMATTSRFFGPGCGLHPHMGAGSASVTALSLGLLE